MPPGEAGEKLLRTLPDAFPAKVAVYDNRIFLVYFFAHG
jgi:hypothetical protein